MGNADQPQDLLESECETLSLVLSGRALRENHAHG